MNPSVAHLLTRLYPRAWRDRYGVEFEAMLVAGRGDLRVVANVVWSAISERFFPVGGYAMSQDSLSLHSGWVRTPWAMFGLAPLLCLAGAYFVACLILWSGWGIFLPETDTPFVRIDGLAIFYFGVGRLIYYGAPIFIGWGVGVVAARQKIRVVWPIIGLVMIALMGALSQVRASRSGLNGVRHVSMGFGVGHSVSSFFDVLIHVLVILTLTLLPYLIWRFYKSRSASA